MRWCSFTTGTTGVRAARLGCAPPGGRQVLDVGAWAGPVGGTPVDLVDLVEAGPAEQRRVTDLVRTAEPEHPGWRPLAQVRLLAPLRAPNSLRDFLGYRDHVECGAARRGVPVPEPWDRIPVYYKGNRRSIIGPDEVAPWPSYTDRLDYEAEVAAVVGRGGRDVAESAAGDHVFGYTLMNDWSARDVQRDEMACWLGPAKGKDFATTLGPWVVTPDEWDPAGDHEITVTVDGERWSTGSTAGRRWSFAQMIAWVSRDEDLWATDVLGSGTFGGGCGLDLDRWLHPGARVVLAVAGLGAVTNTVAPKPG